MNISKYITACVGEIVSSKTVDYQSDYIVIDGKTFYADEIIGWEEPRRTKTLVEWIEHGSAEAKSILEEIRKTHTDHDSPKYIRRMVDGDIKESKQNEEIDRIFAREFTINSPRWWRAKNFKDYLKMNDIDSLLNDIGREKDRNESQSDALFILNLLHDYGVGALSIAGQFLFVREKILGINNEIVYAIPESEAWRNGMCGGSKKFKSEPAKAMATAFEDVKYMINNSLMDYDRKEALELFSALRKGPRAVAKLCSMSKNYRHARSLAIKIFSWLGKSADIEKTKTYKETLDSIEKIPEILDDMVGQVFQNDSGEHKVEYEYDGKFYCTTEGGNEFEIPKLSIKKNPGDIEVKPKPRTANIADINKRVLESTSSAMIGAKARFVRAKKMLELARLIKDKNRLMQAENEMEEAENSLSFCTRKYNDAVSNAKSVKKNGSIERYLAVCAASETAGASAKKQGNVPTVPAPDPAARAWTNEEIQKVAIFELRNNREAWPWLNGINGSQILELSKIIAKSLSSSIRSDNARKKRLGLGDIKFSEKVMRGFMPAQSRAYCGLVM
jgi:hypothetical protein